MAESCSTKSLRKSNSQRLKQETPLRPLLMPFSIATKRIFAIETSNLKIYYLLPKTRASAHWKSQTLGSLNFWWKNPWQVQLVVLQATWLQRCWCKNPMEKLAIIGVSELWRSFCCQDLHLSTKKTTLLFLSRLSPAGMILKWKPGEMFLKKQRTLCLKYWFLTLKSEWTAPKWWAILGWQKTWLTFTIHLQWKIS